MAKNNNKAFTLVELLAVIVILAIILVIAVPQIISTITESRKGALASSAKLIASSAESMKISNQALGIEKDITCQDVSSYTEEDYTCNLEFVDGKAKVTLVGKGKFDGMAVCGGTKDEAIVKMKNSCPAAPVSFSTDSWETISEAVKDGNTSKYNVGDTRTINLGTTLGTHTVRIANKSNDWEHCGEDGYSQTACGFVIEFADIITTHYMNDTYTNAGGWKDSAMRTYVNGTIYNALVSAIGNIIENTTVVSGYESGKTTNYTTTDKVYLLSPEEIYGSVFTSSNDTSKGTSRQLDYYIGKITSSDKSVAIKQFSGTNVVWWLRSAYSGYNSEFCTVKTSSAWFYSDANNTYGVSPAFRLG